MQGARALRQTTRPPGSVQNRCGGQEEYEVEAILAERGRGRRRRFLVKWRGWPQGDATWESAAALAGAQQVLGAWLGATSGGTSQSSAPAHPLPAAASVVDAAAAAAAPPAVEGVTHSSESAAGAATSLGVLPAVAGGSVLAPGPPPAAGATTSLQKLLAEPPPIASKPRTHIRFCSYCSSGVEYCSSRTRRRNNCRNNCRNAIGTLSELCRKADAHGLSKNAVGHCRNTVGTLS